MSLIGSLLYKFYYSPKGRTAYIKKFGGKKNYHLMIRGESEMRGYALDKLRIDHEINHNAPYRIHFLTGEKYIHQSLFCTYSFLRFFDLSEIQDFHITFYDDGSLEKSTVQKLRRNHPFINIVPDNDTVAYINSKLPIELFPFIHKKLKYFPLIKKLVYPHVNNTGLNCLFDSDMLFFQRPHVFIDWVKLNVSDANKSIGMLDVQRCFGYGDDQIKTAWGTPPVNNINSGFYGIHSKAVDFNLIEELIKKLETSYGPNYYLEQLLTAILLESLNELTIVPKSEYIVLPTKAQILAGSGTLQHYVDLSKEFYFKSAWKTVL